jgi:hypothetical protein
MMTKVQLNIQAVTYQRFLELKTLLNTQYTAHLSESIGENLADIACQIVEQVFGYLSEISAKQQQFESEHTVEQIISTIRKHLPWSMQLLNQQRLQSLIDDLAHMTTVKNGQIWLTYPITHRLAQQLQQQYQALAQSPQHIAAAFSTVIEIIDQGVTQLVREPKKKLKFNFVVDKSLAGVIGLTTQMGYKRLEKMGNQLTPAQAAAYLQHFLNFIQISNHQGSQHDHTA